MNTTKTLFVPTSLPGYPTCFINLSSEYIQANLSAYNVNAYGALGFELTWEVFTENSVTTKSAIVGWVGGICKVSRHREALELSREFSQCIGLEEVLSHNPNMFISLQHLESVPLSPRINVDPVSADDWEILELHAGVLETKILHQISVVYDGEIVPLWINPTTIIFIRVLLSQYHGKCVRLGSNTEIVVYPKLRVSRENPEKLPSVFTQSPPLCIQPLKTLKGDFINQFGKENEAIEDVRQGFALVHPCTFIRIEGVKQLINRNADIYVTVWNDENFQKDENPVIASEYESGYGVILSLLASSRVVPGHLLMTEETLDLLDLQPKMQARVRVLASPPQPYKHITLKRISKENEQKYDNNGSNLCLIDASHTRQNFIRWCASLTQPIPFGEKGIVDLANEADKTDLYEVHISYSLTEDCDSSGNHEQNGTLDEYVLLGGSLGILPDPQTIIISNEESKKQHQLNFTSERKIAIYSPYISKSLDEISQYMNPIILRNVAWSRGLLRAPPSGGILLHGPSGVGKTTHLKEISYAYQKHFQSMAHTQLLDCASLRGLKMIEVKDKLNEMFSYAWQHGPAIIALDNLNTLIPAESEDPGAPNQQARELAEVLAELLKTNRRGIIERTNSVIDLFETIRKDSRVKPEDINLAKIELSQEIVKSCICIIATAPSFESIHQLIRSCGLIDRPIAISLPNKVERKELLVSFVKSSTVQGLELSSSSINDMDDVALLTNGYSIRDLLFLASKATACHLRRLNRDDESQNINNRSVKLMDFEEALIDFTPSSLIGVKLFKSDVHWNDIGGLYHVKETLKDILELPKRFSRLYQSAPIKLPSGILLYGFPGCGKTLLAAAVASECGLNFISIKGPELLNKYIGASEQAVRDLFSRAAAAAPSILFLDEFDSIAPRRGSDNTGVTDRVVNQLLTFLDGVESRTGIYILAATSRPDMIDPAILRPGRLDKSLFCDFPDSKEKLDILQCIGKRMNLDSEAYEYLIEIAFSEKTQFYSGADLNALLFSAQLNAVHESIAMVDRKSNTENDSEETKDISLITKCHLNKALEESRRSVSELDRLRYHNIYSFFSGSRTKSFVAASGEYSNTQRTALA